MSRKPVSALALALFFCLALFLSPAAIAQEEETEQPQATEEVEETEAASTDDGEEASEKTDADDEEADKAEPEEAAAKEPDPEPKPMGQGAIRDDLEQLKANAELLSSATMEMAEAGDDKDRELDTQDLQTMLEEFTSTIEALEKSHKTLVENHDRMKADAADHLEKWSQQLKEIGNEDIREKGGDRRKEVVELFEEFQATMKELAKGYPKIIADCRDVEKYLKFDLSKSGLAELEDPLTDISKASGKLQETIGKILGQLGQLPLMQPR